MSSTLKKLVVLLIKCIFNCSKCLNYSGVLVISYLDYPTLQIIKVILPLQYYIHQFGTCSMQITFIFPNSMHTRLRLDGGIWKKWFAIKELQNIISNGNKITRCSALGIYMFSLFSSYTNFDINKQFNFIMSSKFLYLKLLHPNKV